MEENGIMFLVVKMLLTGPQDLISSNYLGLNSEWMCGAAYLKKYVEEWPINRSFAEKNLKYPSHIRRLGNSEVKLKQLGRFSRDKVW